MLFLVPKYIKSIMCNWIQAVMMSAISWGTADTVFDVIIAAHGPGQEDLEEKGSYKTKKSDSSKNEKLF